MCCLKKQDGHILTSMVKKWSRRALEMRQFNVFKLRHSKSVFSEALEKFRKFQEKLKEQEHQRRTLLEEAKRRKIYEKHLLPYQRGSNFLRDFHTNRF